MITNSAEACMDVGASYDKYGAVVTNCAPVYFIKSFDEDAISEVTKKHETLNYLPQISLVSSLNKNAELNAKYAKTDKLNSYAELAVLISKYDMTNIIDNRYQSIAAVCGGYTYSVINSNEFKIGTQSKDVAVRADRIAIDKNGDVVISSLYGQNDKFLSYYDKDDQTNDI